MNWEAMGAIGEVVGAIGVMTSLLYLALQIRGDAKAKRASAVHDQTDAYRDFLKTMATDGELSAIYKFQAFVSAKENEIGAPSLYKEPVA